MLELHQRWHAPAAALAALLGCTLLFMPFARAGQIAETASVDDLGLLVSYSFDEQRLDSGPDTFRVFESSKGSVNLCSLYRISGYNAIEIRDVAADHDFPELQGYFPLRRSGKLWAHFALLITDPTQELNVALAGPRWFQLGRDGIAFWLSMRDGHLVHVSDSIPKRLFQPAPFVWYHVDLELDIDGGIYDLRIEEEGAGEAMITLLDQPNAASQPGSAIDKFSFIGDRGQDTSNVVYYVDDVALAAGEPVHSKPLVAPGRRRLFVDALDDLRDAGTAACLPAVGLEDHGVTPELIDRLREAGATETLAQLTSPEALSPVTSGDDGSEAGTVSLAPQLRARRAWVLGCHALEQGDAEGAIASLGEAVELIETSRAYEAAYTLALALEQRWAEVDEWLAWLESEWADDPRLLALLARTAMARGEPGSVESRLTHQALEVLREAPSRALEGATSAARRPSLHRPGTEAQSTSLRHEILPLQYFAFELWQGRFERARDYALAVARHLETAGRRPGEWLERAGDAAFHDQGHLEALELYSRSLEHGSRTSVLLKLSDVHFRLGDLDEERRLREAVYGRLGFD